MINTISEAIRFIETSHYKTSNQNNLKSVLKKYGDKERNLKTVHITGTNGKGSTSKMLSDILKASDYKVGLFTSPHMIVANDRIRINNTNISDKDLIFLLNFFYNDIVQYKLNFFQIYVLIALRYFYNNKVDIAIIEVGIGGRLDSTNVVNSMISVITNINYDHTEKLGNSLESIAFEKAGIIKEGNTTITAVTNDKLFEIIKEQADLKHSDLIKISPSESKVINDKLYFKFEKKDYTLNTMAYYQAENAQIVLMAVKILNQKYGFKISQDSIIKAFNNFSWIGRFEQVSNNPNIILDGAHNVAGIKALIKSTALNRKYVVIFSALRDKEYEKMLNLLVSNFDEVVFCQFDFFRGLKISDLKKFEMEKFLSFDKSLDYLKVKYPKYDILVCGSLYFISEIRKTLIR